MKTKKNRTSSLLFEPECIPCIVNQAYNTSKIAAKANKYLHIKILKAIFSEIQTINHNSSAPYLASAIQSKIKKITGNNNHFAEIKLNNYNKVKQFRPFIEKIIDGSRDRLETAIRIAIIGNIIDLAANPDFDIEYEMNRIASSDFHLSDLEKLKNDLEKAKLILYIGDNFEEAFFDKFLIKELNSFNIVFAVRSTPILNDITLEDAKKLKLNKICKVIESGSKIAGTDVNKCSREFKEYFQKADIVIAKGQGNYETLINEKRSIYFLFKVKCKVIEEKTGYLKGKGILLYSKSKAKKING
jgi:hypothetical protein